MTKKLNKTLVVLIFTLILTGGGCAKNKSDDIVLESAKKDFLPLTYSFTEQRKDTTIRVFTEIAKAGKLSFLSEDVNYEITTNPNFPYTANSILTLFVDIPNPYEFVDSEKFFLYDSSRGEWLPISESISKVYMKDKKIVKEIISTSDLWEEGNDWRELYKY